MSSKQPARNWNWKKRIDSALAKCIKKTVYNFKLCFQKFSYHELLTILSLGFASYRVVTLLTYCLLVQTV